MNQSNIGSYRYIENVRRRGPVKVIFLPMKNSNPKFDTIPVKNHQNKKYRGFSYMGTLPNLGSTYMSSSFLHIATQTIKSETCFRAGLLEELVFSTVFTLHSFVCVKALMKNWSGSRIARNRVRYCS